MLAPIVIESVPNILSSTISVSVVLSVVTRYSESPLVINTSPTARVRVFSDSAKISVYASEFSLYLRLIVDTV